MIKIRKNIILSVFFIITLSNYVCAFDNDNLLTPKLIDINSSKQNASPNYFNLANIVDTLINNDNETVQDETKEDDEAIRKKFVSSTSKFNQGNAKVAYDEYEALIEELDNDTSLLTLSKVLLEVGYFSLAQKAWDKIIYKNQFELNINELKKSYLPEFTLSKDDEIYFAKLYSGIYFDNSANEVINELQAKKKEYQTNDYANFMLSRANLAQKKYSQALNSINKAINLNPDNVNYYLFKVDILLEAKKYKDAKSLIEKIEKDKLSINFIDLIQSKKQTILAYNSKDEREKKYYILNKEFLEGNFEKTKKDCQNILNFDKDNAKIISLYAKSELALGNIERANSFFVNSYKIEKDNLDTMIGLGDIRYIHEDYKNAIKIYKKALKKDKNNYEIIIKLALVQRQYAKYPKELKKLELLLDRMPKTQYLSWYKAAISIAQKNDVLKEEFLKRTLGVNPLYENALGELVGLELKNKNFINAKGLIDTASYTLSKNYYYYYLLGMYNQATEKKRDAVRYYKTSLNLNPNFETANIKLLNLIPDSASEEI